MLKTEWFSVVGGGPAYVEDYDLQNYVPVPVAGEVPVKVVARPELMAAVTW